MYRLGQDEDIPDKRRASIAAHPVAQDPRMRRQLAERLHRLFGGTPARTKTLRPAGRQRIPAPDVGSPLSSHRPAPQKQGHRWVLGRSGGAREDAGCGTKQRGRTGRHGGLLSSGVKPSGESPARDLVRFPPGFHEMRPASRPGTGQSGSEAQAPAPLARLLRRRRACGQGKGSKMEGTPVVICGGVIIVTSSCSYSKRTGRRTEQVPKAGDCQQDLVAGLPHLHDCHSTMDAMPPWARAFVRQSGRWLPVTKPIGATGKPGVRISEK
jgi:hypothetical protein